jgi:hypothetical protein
MKGLLIDSFYKNIGIFKVMAFFTVTFSIFVMITGHETILTIFFIAIIVTLSATSVSNVRKDAEVKWDKFALTLPVRRDEIIMSKYIGYLFWIFAGVMVVIIVTALAVRIHGNVFFTYYLLDISNLIALGMGIALIAGALFFPLTYLLGVDKSEILLIISELSACSLAVFFVWLVNLFEKLSILTRQGIFMLIVTVVFGISFIVTMKIYRRKEF